MRAALQHIAIHKRNWMGNLYPLAYCHIRNQHDLCCNWKYSLDRVAYNIDIDPILPSLHRTIYRINL